MARYGAEYGHEYDAWGASPQWGEGGPRGGYPGQDGWYGGGSYGYGGSRGGSSGYGYEEWGPRGDEFSGRGAGGEQIRYGYGAGGGYRGSHGGYGSEMEPGGRGREEGMFQSGYRSGGARPYEGGYRAGGYQTGGYQGGGYGAGYGGGYEGGYGRDTGGGRSGRSSSRASEIMTENPEVVTPDATLADAAAKMRDLNVGIIPVVESMENRRLRGVITDRDIAIRAIAEGKDGKAKVSECMTAGVESVNKNDGIDRVLSLMESEQIRRVPVTDREGRVVGIIAQADLAVDYGEGRPRAEHRVQQAIERISEPARPERLSGGMQAQGRQGSQGSKRTEGSSGRGDQQARDAQEGTNR